MPRHGAIGCFRWTLADHDLGRDEGLASAARARPRYPERSPGAQARRQLAPQRASSLNEQRLIDGFMANAHGLIVREVDQELAGDLLWARSDEYTSEQFQKLMSDHGVVCSMSRSGNVWDNAAMESFFSSLKTERTARKTYRTRDQAKADVFDYIECFYNPKRRHSTIGYLSPVEFERQAGFA